MTVVIPAAPAPVPPCEPKPSGRSFVTGIRAAAIGASDSADVMRASSAPEGWEGDAAELADHAMTSTADDLDGAVAAMQAAVAAGEVFFDQLDLLVDRRTTLVERREAIVADLDDFAARAASYDVETEEAGLQAESQALTTRIQVFEGDVRTWSQDLSAAEDTFVAALQSHDSVAEGDAAAGSAPDTDQLAQQLSERADDPEALNRWWQSLSPAQREALKIDHPELVGNGNGIPTVDRDDANRANLSEDLNTLQQREADGELSEEDAARLERLEGIYAAMRLNGSGDDDPTNDVIDPATGEPVQPYLMVYAPDAALGDGMAALAWGNPDTADNVSVNVPGFSSTMDNFDGVSGDALNVYESATQQDSGSVASIAWLGYNAPDFAQWDDPMGLVDGTGVANEALARGGAANLSDFIDGLRSTDKDPPPHLTAIGHSYGSTTVAKASGDGLDVDATVLVGSPGAGAGNDHASDLSGEVYVGSAQDDFVTRFGNSSVAGLGDDPAGADFGATRFQVDDAVDNPFSIDNHTSYFDDGSTSLDSVGSIVAGNGDQVEAIDGRSGSETPLWWADNTAGEAGRWLGERAEDIGEGIYHAGEDALDAGRDLVESIPRPRWPF